MCGAWRTIARAVGGAFFAAGSLLAGQLASVSQEAQARQELAREYLRAGQTENAEREFLRALALDPSRDEILLDLAKLHIRGDALAEAETNLREYLAAHPQAPLALGLAGEVKFRRRDYAGAERYLTQVLALQPDDGLAHKLLALCYGASGQWRKGRKASAGTARSTTSLPIRRISNACSLTSVRRAGSGARKPSRYLIPLRVPGIGSLANAAILSAKMRPCLCAAAADELAGRPSSRQPEYEKTI